MAEIFDNTTKTKALSRLYPPLALRSSLGSDMKKFTKKKIATPAQAIKACVIIIITIIVITFVIIV